MMKRVLAVGILIIFVLTVLTACTGKTSSDADKFIGKWKDKNGVGFTLDIKKESDTFTCMMGDKTNPNNRTVTNGKYDEKTKQLVFAATSSNDNDIVYSYDSTNDEIVEHFSSGNTGNYVRVK